MAEGSSLGCDLEDENDVPPLEDMTDLIQQVNELRTKDVSTGPNLVSSLPATHDRPKTTSEVLSGAVVNKGSSRTESSKAQKSFGGFKKGFLNNPKPKTGKSVPPNKSPTKLNTNAEIPLIKPKNPERSGKEMEIPEVQAAMQSSIPSLEKEDWITNDLLKKIEKNPSLAKMLMDPKFTAALSQVPTDPQKAATMLESDPEMQKALKEFRGILGEHFTKLGDKNAGMNSTEPQGNSIGLEERSSTRKQPTTQTTTSASPEDEAKMKDIMSDPKVMKVLQDPQVQRLLSMMRSNPEAAQLEVRAATPEMRVKLQKLVEVGLLGFAS